MNRRARNLVAILASAALAVALASPCAAGAKLNARVGEPFEVDGKPYVAGPVVVEHLRDFTPSSALCAVWVGSEFVGVLRADRVPDTDDPTDSLTFERDARGTLVLVGYASAVHGVHGEFRFRGASGTLPPPAAVARR